MVHSVSPKFQNTPDPPLAFRRHVHEGNPVKYDGVATVEPPLTLVAHMRAVILQSVGGSGYNSTKVLDLPQEVFVERLKTRLRFNHVHRHQLPGAETRLLAEGEAGTKRVFHCPVNAGRNPRSHLIDTACFLTGTGPDVEFHKGNVQRPLPAVELPAKGHGFKESDKNEASHKASVAAGIGQWGKRWD